MNYLLDTHVFIWAMEDKKRLTEKIKSEISDSRNKVFISVVTVWEMIIKSAKKKLKVPKSIKVDILKGKFQLLPIEIEHVLEVEGLPLYHNDPFDRILIAQAKVEGLIIITADPKIWKYRLSLVKA